MLRIFLSFVFVSSLVGVKEVESQVNIDDASSSFIGNVSYSLKDGDCNMDIDDVINSNGFTESNNAVPNFFVTESCYWLKTSILKGAAGRNYYVEVSQPTIAVLDFYVIQNGNLVAVKQTGMSRPFESREIEFTNCLFKIPETLFGDFELYIKVSSGDQLQVPVRIHSERDLYDVFYRQYLWVGLYLGIFLVMILYNGFVWYSTKDKSYLYYVIYITVVGATQLNYQGFLYQFLYPSTPSLAIHVNYVLGALSGATAIVFMQVFVNTKKHTPLLDKGFRLFLAVYLIAIILSLSGMFNLSYQTIQLNAMMLSIYMIIVALKISRKGIRTAQYFLISWSVFLIGVTIFVLKDYGVLPYNMFTYNTMAIGSALEVILLSFALADRINQLKKDKEQEQYARIRAVEENERIVREQNVFLESKVEERTIELRASNNELNETLESLKSAQVQLVDAEKMASLGQMTAGIAHELNNPINFVSSNISPLKRDLDDVIEVLDKYDSLSDKPENVSHILKEIEELKEEIELDYVRQEIGDLLKGIEDGANRTSEIVKGLRVFSRLDEDALKKANINDCITSTLVILESSLNGEVDIVRELDNSIAEINCFPGKLNQVFMNIIVNAVQATKEAARPAGEALVRIATSQSDSSVLIEVEDNGVGMNDEVKAHIFDPFYTTKEVGEGTGLGLSIVLGIINDHQGKIEVESEVGSGTKFLITLPKSL